jgi:hypothetical protein
MGWPCRLIGSLPGQTDTNFLLRKWRKTLGFA